MPGIHDGHSHPFAGGKLLTLPSLNYAILDLDQFVNRIRKLLAKVADREPDGWMEVQLWDATAMDKLPTKKDLDGLPTRRPIIVYSLDGHIALANSRALAFAGIDSSTPDPPGGEIRRGRGREPPGSCSTTRSASSPQIPPPTAEQDADALAAGYRTMAEAGITTCLHASARQRELAALARSPTAARCPCARTSRSGRGRGGLRPGGDARPGRGPALDLRPHRGRNRQPEDVLRRRDRVPDPDRGAAEAVPGQQGDGGRPSWTRGKDRGPTYWEPRSPARRSAPPTPPAGRSTCTRSATARCARRSTPSRPRSPPTGGPTTGTRSPTSS